MLPLAARFPKDCVLVPDNHVVESLDAMAPETELMVWLPRLVIVTVTDSVPPSETVSALLTSIWNVLPVYIYASAGFTASKASVASAIMAFVDIDFVEFIFHHLR